MPIDFDAIRRRRVELNRLIRRECMVRNAVPILANQPWAKRWRTFHQISSDVAIKQYRRELNAIASLIGPAPKFWKLRPLKSTERIARYFKPVDTVCFGEAA